LNAPLKFIGHDKHKILARNVMERTKVSRLGDANAATTGAVIAPASKGQASSVTGNSSAQTPAGQVPSQGNASKTGPLEVAQAQRSGQQGVGWSVQGQQPIQPQQHQPQLYGLPQQQQQQQQPQQAPQQQQLQQQQQLLQQQQLYFSHYGHYPQPVGQQQPYQPVQLQQAAQQQQQQQTQLRGPEALLHSPLQAPSIPGGSTQVLVSSGLSGSLLPASGLASTSNIGNSNSTGGGPSYSLPFSYAPRGGEGSSAAIAAGQGGGSGSNLVGVGSSAGAQAGQGGSPPTIAQKRKMSLERDDNGRFCSKSTKKSVQAGSGGPSSRYV
jgi:hypothetical protein